jgi:ABC-2 type transport system permease protein
VSVRPLTAQLRVELILTLRRGESLLITLVVPVVLLIFFGSVAPNPPDFLVPGLLALAVMSTSMVSLGIATAYERYYGTLKRLMGSPLPRSSLIAAKTLAVLLIEIVQIAILIGIARFMLGWYPAGDLVPALAALVLGSLAFAGLGLLMAGTLRAELTLAAANGLYLALLLLGGMVVPLDKLPGGLQAVAKLLPAAAMSDVLHCTIGDAANHYRWAWIVLVAWAIAAPLAAALTFRWE